jgi:hypothetical protein
VSKCWKQEKSNWKRDGFVRQSLLSLGALDSVRWCTGQCPVCQAGLGGLAALGTSTAVYGYKSPDCPVSRSQAKSSLSGSDQRRTAKNHRTVRWCTGLSGEPTVSWANGRLRIPRVMCGRANGHNGAPDCPVCTG